MLNSVHAKTLNASTSICFAAAHNVPNFIVQLRGMQQPFARIFFEIQTTDNAEPGYCENLSQANVEKLAKKVLSHAQIAFLLLVSIKTRMKRMCVYRLT